MSFSPFGFEFFLAVSKQIYQMTFLRKQFIIVLDGK